MDFVLIRESFKPFKLTEYCACESHVWLIHNADLEKGMAVQIF